MNENSAKIEVEVEMEMEDDVPSLSTAGYWGLTKDSDGIERTTYSKLCYSQSDDTDLRTNDTRSHNDKIYSNDNDKIYSNVDSNNPITWIIIMTKIGHNIPNNRLGTVKTYDTSSEHIVIIRSIFS